MTAKWPVNYSRRNDRMGWTYRIGELAKISGGTCTSEADLSFHRVSTDTRTLQPGEVFFALSGDRYDGNRFVAEAFEKGAAAAVTSTADAGGPCVVVQDPLEALQAFAGFHREQFEIPVIAITGSCGKTSSKDLVAAVLETRYCVEKTRGNLNNEIGLPLSILEWTEETEAAVLEMGANHRGEIAHLCSIAKPTEAAITMIAEAHLEGFGTLEDVAAAKAEIVEGLPKSGLFYVNVDDPYCREIAARFSGRKTTFGASGDVALEACTFNEAGEMDLRVKPVGELVLPLHARAHAANVLLAIAVGLEHDVVSFEEPLRRACSEATRFTILHLGPLLAIDDSYNANPASVRAALEALRDRPVSGARMAALGDMLELGPSADALHEAMGRLAGECGVERLYTRGSHAEATAKGARAAGVAHVQVLDTHEDIANDIAKYAKAGDALLVKGSRGMAMEKIIDRLRECFDAQVKSGAKHGGAGGA